MDEDRALMQRETVRRRLEVAGLAAMGLGMAVAGLIVALGDRAGEVADRVMLGGCALAGAGAVLTIVAWRPKADRRRLEARETRRDRTQRVRRSRLATMPFASIGLLVVAMSAAWRVIQGQGDFGDLMWAGLVVLIVWIVPLMVLGWDGEGRRDRKWLEDELTREWRGRAMSLGFLVLMGGMSGLYLIGLFRPQWAIVGFPVIMMASAGAVGLRFAWLDDRAERDDG